MTSDGEAKQDADDVWYEYSFESRSIISPDGYCWAWADFLRNTGTTKLIATESRFADLRQRLKDRGVRLINITRVPLVEPEAVE